MVYNDGNNLKIEQNFLIHHLMSLPIYPYPKAFQYLESALKISYELHDNVSSWASNHWIGHALAEYCEFERFRFHIKKALEIVGKANDPWSTYSMQVLIFE